MKPKITVCIGTYNGANRLPTALRSLSQQTYCVFDVLVVDDGSTDRTAEIARQFGARLIVQENKGLGAARRVLVESAETDLIAFLDDDDEWPPEKLERHLAFHKFSGAVLSHTSGFWVWPDGRKERREVKPPETNISYEHVLPRNLIMAPSVIFSRQAMVDAGNFVDQVRYASDWYGWLKIARTGNFAFLDEPLLYYSRREGQNTQQGLKFSTAELFMLENEVLRNWEQFVVTDIAASNRYRHGLQLYLSTLHETLARQYWHEQKNKRLAIRHAAASIWHDAKRRSHFGLLARLLLSPHSIAQ